MQRIEDVLSRQYCNIEFKDGKVNYFSISTQHGSADSLEEAINNIIEADNKFDGMSGFRWLITKMEREYDNLSV